MELLDLLVAAWQRAHTLTDGRAASREGAAPAMNESSA